MPACSAMARRRLSTRHTGIQGASQSAGYSLHLPLAAQKAAQMAACTPRMRRAMGRDERPVATLEQRNQVLPPRDADGVARP
jgi:hypothetical protein